MTSTIEGFPRDIVDDVIARIQRYPKFDETRQDGAIALLQGPEDVMQAALAKYETDVTIFDFKTARHNVSCNCPDHTYRGLYCKHIIALWAYHFIIHETEQEGAAQQTIGENVPDDPADSATDRFDFITPEEY